LIMTHSAPADIWTHPQACRHMLAGISRCASLLCKCCCKSVCPHFSWQLQQQTHQIFGVNALIFKHECLGFLAAIHAQFLHTITMVTILPKSFVQKPIGTFICSIFSSWQTDVSASGSSFFPTQQQ
jgi:hypothetical protein